jgi:hypothetical protein
MDKSIEQHEAHFYLVLAPRPVGRAWMNAFAARLALAGPALVLDGGNSFDALGIARQVRRQTADLEMALGRLRVARAFTCYQMVAMLASLSGQPALLVFDLLATFCDESVALTERARLLEQALAHLRRLSVTAPLAVSASTSSDADARLPLGHPARLAAPLPAMLARLEEAADQVLRYTNPPDGYVQGKLFSF